MGRDPTSRLEIIKSFAAEIVTEEDLLSLFETKTHPYAYDGFEPSGFAHIPLALYRPILISLMSEAGFKFKILLADSYAWINNKFGGDIEKIRTAAQYFIEVWKVAGRTMGLDLSNVEYVWHKDFMGDDEYWRKVLLIAKAHTLKRTRRALTIAGRTSAESQQTAVFFYPSMQAADIFHLPVDTPQLGIDQRKVNMLARDIAHKKIRVGSTSIELYKLLNYEGWGVNGKPVPIHHRLLPSLAPPPKVLPGYDEDLKKDFLIAWKMSKSRPETVIYIHDDEETIYNKIKKAFCPPKAEVEYKVSRGNKSTVIKIENPVLVYLREIVFRVRKSVAVKTKEGEDEYSSFEDLTKDYEAGKIHPLDLKEALARELNSLISPIRKHFESGHPKKLYDLIRTAEITR